MATAIGDNVQYEEKDGKIILTIDPKVDLGLSSTGKMRGVANTGGFTKLPNGMKLNLYLGKSNITR